MPGVWFSAEYHSWYFEFSNNKVCQFISHHSNLMTLALARYPTKAITLTNENCRVTCHILDGPLQIELPEVDVLDPLAQLAGDVILGRVGPGVGAVDQLLGLITGAEIMILMLIAEPQLGLSMK